MGKQAINALSKAIFQDDSAQLTLEHLQSLSLDVFAAYWIKDRLPEEYASQARQTRAQLIALDMMLHAAYREIEILFKTHHISFCALKGADLAWRVYPAGWLRPKCDLDILIHRDDLQNAVKLLQNNGWKTPYQYPHKYHFPQMQKGRVPLELHFLLPCWEHIAENDVWKELRKISDFQYQLPLELNLAMLFNHALYHHWTNGRKMLLDCAFLVKTEGAPDWQKIAELEKTLKIHSPALLFYAFSDFFPAAAFPPKTFPDELGATFRHLIFDSETVQAYERTFADEHRNSWRWWLEHFHTFPANVRINTGNPSGHYGRLLLGYGTIIFSRLSRWRQLKHSGLAPAVAQRLKDEQTIETYIKEH